jgi:hypothetical protein
MVLILGLLQLSLDFLQLRTVLLQFFGFNIHFGRIRKKSPTTETLPIPSSSPPSAPAAAPSSHSPAQMPEAAHP